MHLEVRLMATSLLAATGSVLADSGGSWDEFEHSMMWGFGMFGGFGMLLFWGLIFVSILLVAKLAIPGSKYTESSDALTILNRRFAKGEIDETEYLERKRMLDQS